MARVLGLAVLALTTLSGAASAQENWLIGTWLTTQMDPRGVSNYAMASRFEPNGRLIIQMAVSGSGGSGMQTFLATWRMTGPASYVAQIIDYEPKQSCGAMGCITVPPTIPMGTTQNCSFQPINQVAIAVSCDGQAPTQFTRQN